MCIVLLPFQSQQQFCTTLRNDLKLIDQEVSIGALVSSGLHMFGCTHDHVFRVDPTGATRAVGAYLDTLQEATSGAVSEFQPKFTLWCGPANQGRAAR